MGRRLGRTDAPPALVDSEIGHTDQVSDDPAGSPCPDGPARGTRQLPTAESRVFARLYRISGIGGVGRAVPTPCHREATSQTAYGRAQAASSASEDAVGSARSLRGGYVMLAIPSFVYWTCQIAVHWINTGDDSIVDMAPSYGDDPRNGCPVWRVVRDGLSVDIPSASVLEWLASLAGVTLIGLRPGAHIVTIDYATVMASTVGVHMDVTWADGRAPFHLKLTPAELWAALVGLAEVS